MNARKTIGDNIRGYRKILGLSQKEFSQIAGMNRTYLASVERGEKNITIDTILRIATVIGVPHHLLLQEGAHKWSRVVKKKDS